MSQCGTAEKLTHAPTSAPENKTLNKNKLTSKKCFHDEREKNIKLIMDELSSAI